MKVDESDQEASALPLSRIGETALIDRLVGSLPQLRTRSDRSVLVGPGDDAAVVQLADGSCEVLKTDAIVEGVHFLPGTDPQSVGRKAMNRALSDVAAMGGVPREALVTVVTDSERTVSELEGWYRGLGAAAQTAQVAVVGGETSRLPVGGAIISVSVIGQVDIESIRRRSSARIGDIVAVTGRLGGSFESGRHLDFTPRLAEGEWLGQQGEVSAMMDLSDGLGSDLPKLASASGVGYRIETSKLPRQAEASVEAAIRDGEDYELLVTLDSGRVGSLLSAWSDQFPDLPLTPIGEIVDETEEPLSQGWEHHVSG
ncbi:MAG: thiamine-phosphate kinase [Verrucomicrobiota bacterium]